MKNFIMVLMLAMVAGCANFQFSGDANEQAMAYVAGKGTAIGIYKLYPSAAPSIGRMAIMANLIPEEVDAKVEGVVVNWPLPRTALDG